MAKSIRSKSKRRMRAIKRARLAPRVLKRLQTTVANLDAGRIKMEIENSGVENDPNVRPVRMGTDNAGINLKTMKKSDGSYPIWLSQRKRKQKKNELKRKQKAKKRKAKRNR